MGGLTFAFDPLNSDLVRSINLNTIILALVRTSILDGNALKFSLWLVERLSYYLTGAFISTQ